MRIDKIKNTKGRILCYRAHRSEIAAQGNTPTEAKANLEIAIDAALIRLANATKMHYWMGHLLITFPESDSYAYWIDTFDVKYSISGYKSADDARLAALHHLAQNLWTIDVCDSDFLKGLPGIIEKDMLSWIKFQRAYARLIAEGYNTNDAHRLACAA